MFLSSSIQTLRCLGILPFYPLMVFILSFFRPEIFGRKEIVEYLFKTYGPGIDAIPSALKGSSSFGAGLFTGGGKGSRLRSNARSDITLLKPITLYGWEGENQFVRPVRETLTELGLAHIFVNCATGSANRYFIQHSVSLIFRFT